MCLWVCVCLSLSKCAYNSMCGWLCICAAVTDQQINVIIVCQQCPAVTAGGGYITPEINSPADAQRSQTQIQLLDMS